MKRASYKNICADDIIYRKFKNKLIPYIYKNGEYNGGDSGFQPDFDGDGIPNYLDSDSDNDGIQYSFDNCPNISNPKFPPEIPLIFA